MPQLDHIEGTCSSYSFNGQLHIAIMLFCQHQVLWIFGKLEERL